MISKVGAIVNELFLLGIAITLVVLTAKTHSNQKVDTNHQDQLVADWMVKPFIDFQVLVGQTPGCQVGYEHVYTRDFPGTRHGCNCLFIFGPNITFSH